MNYPVSPTGHIKFPPIFAVSRTPRLKMGSIFSLFRRRWQASWQGRPVAAVLLGVGRQGAKSWVAKQRWVPLSVLARARQRDLYTTVIYTTPEIALQFIIDWTFVILSQHQKIRVIWVTQILRLIGLKLNEYSGEWTLWNPEVHRLPESQRSLLLQMRIIRQFVLIFCLYSHKMWSCMFTLSLMYRRLAAKLGLWMWLYAWSWLILLWLYINRF
jgi:hypothetical protein